MRLVPALRRHRIGIRVRALLCLGGLHGIGAVGTLAAWSDKATATSGTFATGTITLQLDNTKTLAMSTLAALNLLPGESVAAVVTVQNKGTLPLTYTMAATTPAGSPEVTAHLVVAAYSGGAASNAATNGLRAGSCSGTKIAEAALTAGGSAPVATTPRPLAARTGTETLCVTVRLLPSAPVSVQNQLLGTARLVFTATVGRQP
ncbi:TasA family protein [Rhodococcus sp. (in: high G+C Gram-positive bacteria)]|uniref:TasA family protein n=1 Tax=Rhodococcus sp. TaxID=1831 RepID=UPI003B8A6B66